MEHLVPAMLRILLVEDDPLISKSLKMSLYYQGFEVSVGDSIARATAALERESFDLVILDVNLPDGNGFDLCQKIRGSGDQVPIIMLTARVDEESAVRGMTSGADDYVRKPFGVNELVVRANKLLERKIKSRALLSFGSVKIDINKRVAFVGDKDLNLGKREFEILHLLVKKQGDVATREDILSALDAKADIFDRTVDSHLSHLRKKIREAGSVTVQIVPVYGVGYRLEEKAEEK
jgi:DNA-binding response OmpR family regulator